FPPDAVVPTFDPETIARDPMVAKAQRALDGWEAGEPILSGAPTTLTEITLRPGEEADLFVREGSGIVRGLRIGLPATSDPLQAAHVRDHLWLIAHFDDDETLDPSVRCPVGPFFLDFGQEPKPRSLWVGAEPGGAYACRFAMPYAERARIRLVN